MLCRADNQKSKYYYIVHHIDNDAIPFNAQPFNKNGRPTSFAVNIYENIYFRFLSSEKNENIFDEIENGNIYYSVIDSSNEKYIPDTALPLFEFNEQDRISFGNEIRKIRRSIEVKKAWDAAKKLILSINIKSAHHQSPLFYISC